MLPVSRLAPVESRSRFHPSPSRGLAQVRGIPTIEPSQVSKRITLRLPMELYARLEAIAASQRSNVSAVVKEQMLLGLEMTSGVHFSDGISELKQALHATREDVATLALALLVGGRIMDEATARAWIDRSLRHRG